MLWCSAFSRERCGDMKNLLIAWVCAACFVLSSRAQFVVSPFAFGNTGAQLPFLIGSNTAVSVRYQQVYGASDFMRVRTPFLITEIDFGGVTGRGFTVADENLRNVRIDFSTTSRALDDLSLTFANNVGFDNTTVFSGPLHVRDDNLSEYGIRIPLQTPFLYDPSAGNLLLDVRNFQTVCSCSPAGFESMRGEGTLGDTVSSVWAPDVNAASATLQSTLGLVTSFRVTPVPEPGTWALVLVGLGMLLVSKWIPGRVLLRRLRTLLRKSAKPAR